MMSDDSKRGVVSNDNTREYRPVLIGAAPNPEMTFDSFVACRANKLAIEAAKTMCDENGVTYNPFYIHGDIGMGKTHLLSAIANSLIDSDSCRAVMINAVDFRAEIERATRFGKMAELHRWINEANLLLVDDIQLCEGVERLQRELFAVMNHVSASGRGLVISSNVPPARLQGIEDRIISRLDSGVIVGLQMADRDTRLEIIRRAANGTTISDDVLNYLADRVEDNVRHLKAAVNQLVFHHKHAGVEINLDLARSIVPMPMDLKHTPSTTGGETVSLIDGVQEINEKAPVGFVTRFKEMLEGAENEQEHSLALQIALNERIRQLRDNEESSELVDRLEQALHNLREGDMAAAMNMMETIGSTE